MCKAIWIFLTGRNNGDLWSDGTEEFQHCGILAAVMAHLSECRLEKKVPPVFSRHYILHLLLCVTEEEWCAKDGMGISRLPLTSTARAFLQPH